MPIVYGGGHFYWVQVLQKISPNRYIFNNYTYICKNSRYSDSL